MRKLSIAQSGEALRVLCLGAHSDDIEIGCGGTLLNWIAAGVKLDANWVVFSGSPARAAEAERSAADFLAGAARSVITLADFQDGHFPYQGSKLKNYFETLKAIVGHPDVIFTHQQRDRHQDHREVCQLTWNTFRDHLILEYEIPKWDGDFSRPNFYQPLPNIMVDRKIALLEKHFGSQRSKDWFDRETFRGLARLRGMECRADEHLAEAFKARKLTLI